jgi:hypothetical protein
VAISNLDKWTLHHTHRTRKLVTLEVPKKTEQTNCLLAWRTPGLQLQTLTCPQKIAHGSQHPITTPRSWWRQRWQPADDHDPKAAFIRLAGPNSNSSIKHMITIIQNHNCTLMDEWERTYPIEHMNNPDKPFWRDIKGQHLVIPPD